MGNDDTPAIDYGKLLAEVANENDCSEFCVWTWASIQWNENVSARQVEADFGQFLVWGKVPPYIRSYFRNNILEA